MTQNEKAAALHEWFGKIPDRWSSQRIKTLFDMRDERNYLPLSEVNLISLYTNTGVHQHADIEHTTGNKARNADGYKIVAENDIIVNILLCWMGAIGRSDYNGVTSPAYDIYTPKSGVNSKYYHYLFRTPLFSQQCYKVGKGIMSMRWRTYSPQFRNIIVPVPAIEEQEQIVRFLDCKVSRINQLISNHKKHIECFEAMKSNAIDQCTIHGIRNKKLQHNDDRWDIDYPHDWEIRRLRERFTFRKGLSITKADLVSSGIPVISYGQVHSKSNSGVALNDSLFKFIDKAYLTTMPIAIVEKGDFIFADTSEDLAGCGNCAYIDSNETIFAGYHTIIMHFNRKHSNNNKYYAYLFKSPTWRCQVRKRVNAVKVYSITQQILKDMFVLIPSEEDQDEIVNYLDNLCHKIDVMIEKEKLSVEKLHDLKGTLISDVVTGKIDVRDIEIPDYEYVEEETETFDNVIDEEEITEEE